jgi:hypothetical protein
MKELILSEYEKGYLTAFYEAHCEMEEYRCKNGVWYEHLLEEDKEWTGVEIGERVFDLCMYFCIKYDTEFPDEPLEVSYPKDLVVVVYEVFEGCTDMSAKYHLKSTGKYNE